MSRGGNGGSINRSSNPSNNNRFEHATDWHDDDDDDNDDDIELLVCTTIDPITGRVTELELGRGVYRSSSSSSSTTMMCWELTLSMIQRMMHQLAYLNKLTLANCQLKLSDLERVSSTTTTSQLQELHLINCCPIDDNGNCNDDEDSQMMIENVDDNDLFPNQTMNCAVQRPASTIKTLSIQYNCHSRTMDRDLIIFNNNHNDNHHDGEEEGENTTNDHLSTFASLERIVAWSTKHLVQLEHLSVQLRRPSVPPRRSWQQRPTTVYCHDRSCCCCYQTDVPDMIISYLSRPMTSLAESTEVTTSYCQSSINDDIRRNTTVSPPPSPPPSILSNLQSLTLSGCGLTEQHLELLFDELAILPHSSSHQHHRGKGWTWTKLQKLSVDRNDIGSLEFVSRRIQQHYPQHHHHHHNQQDYTTTVGVDSRTTPYNKINDSCRLRPPISTSKLQCLSLSDNPIMTKMVGDGDDDDDDDDSVSSLWQLLYMLPYLHNIGYPSQVTPIVQCHSTIDYMLRINKGGRWLIACPTDQNDNDDEDYGRRTDIIINNSTQNNISSIVGIWPYVLKRSYDQSTSSYGVAGAGACGSGGYCSSSILPTTNEMKDATAMFYLICNMPNILLMVRTPS